MTIVEKLIEIETRGGPNKRISWQTRAKIGAAERGLTRMLLGWKFAPLLPCTITLTRLTSSSRFVDDDNLQGVLKAVRDGIADRLRVDDADPRIEWKYQQKRCKRGEFGVIVRFESL